MGLREFGVLGQGHPGGEWQGRDVRAGSRLGSGPRPQLWPRRPGGGGEARSGLRAPGRVLLAFVLLCSGL